MALDGELDVLHEDYANGGRYVHWLKLGGARLSDRQKARGHATPSSPRRYGPAWNWLGAPDFEGAL